MPGRISGDMHMGGPHYLAVSSMETLVKLEVSSSHVHSWNRQAPAILGVKWLSVRLGGLGQELCCSECNASQIPKGPPFATDVSQREENEDHFVLRTKRVLLAEVTSEWRWS